MQSPRIIISGGGTGGHIFPAIAIANAIKEKVASAEILFVGAKGKMEMEKVPEAGYNIEGLWISGLQRSLTPKNLLFPFKLLSSLFKSNTVFNRFKPDVAVGVGGFASGPMLRVAAAKGIPIVLQEQNSFPGITNRLLGKKASKVCVAYEGMEKFFPKDALMLTGNPVRKEVVDIEGKRNEALAFFGLKETMPVLLIVGGSLGARSVNEALLQHIDMIVSNKIQVVWQTGKFSFEKVSAAIAAKGLHEQVKVHAFIKRMDLAYAVADLVVSRAGAIAVSELTLVAKPSILVPYPFAAEDHQTKNALSLVQNNAAMLVKDSEAADKLPGLVVSLMRDESKRISLSENIRTMGFANAANNIADEVLKLVKH